MCVFVCVCVRAFWCVGVCVCVCSGALGADKLSPQAGAARKPRAIVAGVGACVGVCVCVCLWVCVSVCVCVQVRRGPTR